MLPGIGLTELVLIGVIAIVLFGRKLPEVARNLGKSYGELRRGLNELQSSLHEEVRTTSSDDDSSMATDSDIDDYDEPTAPKLGPPPVDDDSNSAA